MDGTKNIVGKFNVGFIVVDFNKLQYIYSKVWWTSGHSAMGFYTLILALYLGSIMHV